MPILGLTTRLLLSLLLLIALPATAAAKVYDYRLDNGMLVLVKQDRRAPVAVSQVWYRIGASYEEAGNTGLSHVLEHMMFKGTEKLGPGEFSRTIAALGGNENAFTSRDYTSYFETLAVRYLDRALELEADRMRSLKLDEAEFTKEIEVVKEERRMRTDDKPSGLTYEQLMATAWRASPYGNPVIGWMNDLENMQLADLQDWYERWYAPNNAALVVVGDVEPDDVYRLAKRHFGPIEPSELGVLKDRVEPEQRGETRLVVKAPAKEPYLLMGYKVPNIKAADEDWEPYALYVLANVLDGGDSARFSRELVRGSQVAASVSAQYDLYARLPSLFLFSGTPAKDHSIEQLETAVAEQIKRLQTELVEEKELKRIVTGAIAEKVYQADSMFYQAMEVGVLWSNGMDWQLVDEEIPRLKAVTPEQVREVARKYLIDDYLTVAQMQPQPIEGGRYSKWRKKK